MANDDFSPLGCASSDAGDDGYEGCVLELVSRSEAGFRARLERGVDGLLSSVQMLNRSILAVDRLLWRLQPPATGRIRVLWRKTPSRSDGDAVEPYLVKWKQVRRGWQTIRLGTRAEKSVESWGGFERHSDEVREAVLLAKRLIARRSQVLARGRELQLSGEERGRSNAMHAKTVRREIERLVDRAQEKSDGEDMLLSLSYVLEGSRVSKLGSYDSDNMFAHGGLRVSRGTNR